MADERVRRRLGWCCWKLSLAQLLGTAPNLGQNRRKNATCSAAAVACFSRSRPNEGGREPFGCDLARLGLVSEARDHLARAFVWPDAAHEALPRAVGLYRRAALVAAVEADGAWEAAADGAEGAPPLLLQYNDPFTPPWKRRNELALPVRRAA